MEREVGGGIGKGNTCKPMAVSFQCMTKSTTIKKYIYIQGISWERQKGNQSSRAKTLSLHNSLTVNSHCCRVKTVKTCSYGKKEIRGKDNTLKCL